MTRQSKIALAALGLLTLLALAWGFASASDIRSTKYDPSALASAAAETATPVAAAPTTPPRPPPTETPAQSATAEAPAPTATVAPQPTAPARTTPPPPAATVQLPPGARRVLAPIEQAQVVASQSNPPQYTVNLKAGLPSGCARPAGYEVAAAGPAVRVQVFNSMPAGNVVCTQIYGIYDLNVPLGSDFDAGKTYTVDVNDKKLTFVAR